MTHAIPHFPSTFAGLIYLSPVMDPAKIAAVDFESGLGKAPVLVITGAEDNRVSQEYVAGGVNALRSLGSSTSYEVIPGEDHFLFYSQPNVIVELVENWLRR